MGAPVVDRVELWNGNGLVGELRFEAKIYPLPVTTSLVLLDH